MPKFERVATATMKISNAKVNKKQLAFWWGDGKKKLNADVEVLARPRVNANIWPKSLAAKPDRRRNPAGRIKRRARYAGLKEDMDIVRDYIKHKKTDKIQAKHIEMIKSIPEKVTCPRCKETKGVLRMQWNPEVRGFITGKCLDCRRKDMKKTAKRQHKLIGHAKAEPVASWPKETGKEGSDDQEMVVNIFINQ